jgi:hypothetical protein
MKHALGAAAIAIISILAACSASAQTSREATTRPAQMFGIQVVDEQTGRGVPLVELKTVSNRRFYTDSAGWVAIDDPTLMNQRVFFYVTTYGYEFPADGFEFRGRAIDLKPGGQESLKIKRLNIAERLYRITGEGVYRDSVRLGKPVPIQKPLINGKVAGQDSCLAYIYRGRIQWFWGDTLRLAYPLGHYWTAGATSQLPGQGGLDPSDGIDLTYFTDARGFSRPMIDHTSQDPEWLDGLMVVPDGSGAERMVGRATRVKSVTEVVGKSLVIYNDGADKFDKLMDIAADAPLYPRGHPFRVDADGKSYIYCGETLPDIRMKANLESVKDLSSYEAFTPLAAGARFNANDLQLDRDEKGRVVWGWKADTSPLGAQEAFELVKRGKLKEEEIYFRPLDVQTKKPVTLASGSVAFNEFRKKYVMIAVQLGGDVSMLGEVWYSEANAPEGPWPWACRIATHEHYSLYNPVHHAFLDQQGGRVIYFEGTYSNTFSGNDYPTPLYDYNQIMYRLDLSDPRLKLPPA